MENKVNDTDDDAGSFGEETTVPLPVWKRPVWGLSPAFLAGCVVMIVAAAWYLFLRAPAGQPASASDDAFSTIPAWQTSSTPPVPASSPPPPVTATPQVVPASAGAGVDDMNRLAEDLKSELDNRDAKLQGTLNMLQNSISTLSDAIRKDEAYAQETRRMVSDLQTQFSGLSAREASENVAPATAPKKKTVSPVSGMKIMSMETGMAWIRWKGSTWAVREGDTLGRVTITRIDPASRTVTTTGGTLR
ncbi:conjugal transfer protein TraP [Salmonella enterica subsp. diarizonae]|nr:conjugal transfer protein TraP [Salmonella enterica subsp. diarizonae]EDV0069632.1 conjugal transfer protein TraP [Salmonella enterica subsp. enterica serovar Litchfield]EDV1959473.1 conjugal transfer protein TraP [Salmonella enterica subsp. enterica serovar Litchfield]